MVAAALVTTIASGVAYLIVWSRHEAWSAGVRSTAASLAVQKMEQLRSLAWYMDPEGVAVSDGETDLAEDPPRAGALGLRQSPGGSLVQNLAGFVDYLDVDGRWCGTGAQPPPGTAFVRRWAVEPFGGDADDTLVLSVTVRAIRDEAAGLDTSPRTVRLRTIRTRVAR